MPLHSASSFVLKAAANGDLPVRGRVTGTQRYEEIDRHFWHGHLIMHEPHPAHIWKAVVYERPTNKVVAPAYDSYLVEQATVERLWSDRDREIEWLIFKIKAKKFFSSARGINLIAIVGVVIISAAIWSLPRAPAQDDAASHERRPQPATKVENKQRDPQLNEPIATARFLYDPSNGETALTNKSSGIKIASWKKQSPSPTAMSAFPIFVGQFVFNSDIGPFDVSFGVITEQGILAVREYRPLPFFLLTNEDHFVEIRVDQSMFLSNALMPFFGREPIDLYLNFRRRGS